MSRPGFEGCDLLLAQTENSSYYLYMRKLKVYLDTSIINFVDAEDAPEYMAITRDFFNNYLDEYDIYISEIVILEIEKTSNPERKKTLLHIVDKYSLKVYAELNNEIETLANQYIKENVISEKKFEDALHLAFSTFYEFDILLSWNFRHLANIRKQMLINAINEKQGYTKQLHLLNPMEVIYEK